jgi:deazaflavin-dependent oxidoreductase (nitroreductase family)
MDARQRRDVTPVRVIDTPEATSIHCRAGRRAGRRHPLSICGLVSPLEREDDVALQEGEDVADKDTAKPWLPPSWFIHTIWAVHRAAYRITGGRLGLWHPKSDSWGTLRLLSVGRRTGKKRVAILGYYEDGPNLVTMAMNGWMEAEPRWWLNLQAQPKATVELKDGSRAVRARAAQGDERARLWARWREIGPGLDEHATRRSETAVVILEPVSQAP